MILHKKLANHWSHYTFDAAICFEAVETYDPVKRASCSEGGFERNWIKLITTTKLNRIVAATEKIYNNIDIFKRYCVLPTRHISRYRENQNSTVFLVIW